MQLRILAGLAVCAVTTMTASAGEPGAGPRYLSLTDCLDLALARNFEVQIQRLATDIAGLNLNSTLGAYDPTLSFQARHDTVTEPGNYDAKKTGLDNPYKLGTDTIGPELKGALPFGFNYDLSEVGGFTRAQSDLSFSAPGIYPGNIRTTNNFAAASMLSGTQHLLKDAWIDQARETILLRKADLKISKEALRFEVMKIVLAVELQFFDLQAAREEVRVREKAVQLKRQLVAETKRRIEVGELPPLDGEQAASQLQTALTALTAARETYFSRQNQLKGLLTDNFREWAAVDLEPAGKFTAEAETINRDQCFQDALRNRPDLIEARLAVDKSDVGVRFRRNQLFPSLDLIGGYGGLGVETTEVQAVSDASHFRDPVYYYGVVAGFPLGNVKARNEFQAGKAARAIAKLQLRQAEDGVLLQVADYANRLQSRFSQVESTRQARHYAESALKAEQKKLENGFTTSFAVLQYQEILTAAEHAELQALADYNIMQSQFAFAVGNTLERRRIYLGTGPQAAWRLSPEGAAATGTNAPAAKPGKK